MRLSDDEEAGSRGREWSRRAAGWAWILAWAVVLWVVVSPWRHLGGLVDERLRWLERFVLGAAVVIGWLSGSLGRRAARPGTGRSHATLLRRLVLPVAAVAAVTMLVLRLAGRPDPIGVAFTAFLAWWAGFDVAFGAWPLATGRSYGFSTPIDPPDDHAPPEDDAAAPPGWAGL